MIEKLTKNFRLNNCKKLRVINMNIFFKHGKLFYFVQKQLS